VPSVQVAYLDSSVAENGQVSVAGDRLLGSGSFLYNNGVGNPSLWLHNQADYGPTSFLRLDSSDKVVQSSRISGGSLNGTGRLSGTTAANAYALTDAQGGRVHTTANANFGKVALMPVNFISSGDGTVLSFSDFRADLSCKAVAGVGTPEATGSWSATVTYWKDDNPNDDLAQGGYQTTQVSGFTSGAGTGVGIDSIGNPLVYDGSANDDMYLFETETTRGYFTKISTVTSIPSTVVADGSSASATLPGAIHVDTVPTNAAVPNSAVSFAAGQMSCEAVDNR
jgi:hypothetical protein